MDRAVSLDEENYEGEGGAFPCFEKPDRKGIMTGNRTMDGWVGIEAGNLLYFTFRERGWDGMAGKVQSRVKSFRQIA